MDGVNARLALKKAAFARGSFRSRVLGAAARPRQQHADVLPVAAILIAKQIDKVALFELDRDQDVAGGRNREQQMADRHRGRRPESEQEAQIDRVTDDAVKQRGMKLRRRQIFAEQSREDLAQPEKLEMAEHEGGQYKQAPAEERGRIEGRRKYRIVRR